MEAGIFIFVVLAVVAAAAVCRMTTMRAHVGAMPTAEPLPTAEL